MAAYSSTGRLYCALWDPRGAKVNQLAGELA